MSIFDLIDEISRIRPGLWCVWHNTPLGHPGSRPGWTRLHINKTRDEAIDSIGRTRAKHKEFDFPLGKLIIRRQ